MHSPSGIVDKCSHRTSLYCSNGKTIHKSLEKAMLVFATSPCVGAHTQSYLCPIRILYRCTCTSHDIIIGMYHIISCCRVGHFFVESNSRLASSEWNSNFVFYLHSVGRFYCSRFEFSRKRFTGTWKVK